MNNLLKPSRKKCTRRKLGARNYKNYTEEMLDLAVDMVNNKLMSSRDAEKQLGIPRRTILNKLKKLHIKPVGGQTKLSDEEEEKLVKVLIAAGDFGSPMTKLDLKIVVQKYCQKNSLDCFEGKMPSDTWVTSFLKRHETKLTHRTTQNIKKARAEKTLEEMEKYFCNLNETLKEVPPENILNYDETNLSDNPGDAKCIFRRGIKYPERVLNTSKTCISIMFTACAAGYCLPVYVVYKAAHLYSEWVDGGPDGARYNCTKSGWFDSVTFVDYFKTIVIEWAKKLTGPKVIIGDNLSSHLNVDVIELCQEHNIRFVFLPSNSTHLTQPLDVAFFAPLKKEWKKILLQYKLANPAQTTLNKKHFPKLLNQLMQNIKIKEQDIIKSGFQATGIYPTNARSVLKKIPEYFDELGYGVESVLIDYLKETRSPKPMEAKRAKKLKTEPGKSVTSDDIFVKTSSQNVRRTHEPENKPTEDGLMIIDTEEENKNNMQIRKKNKVTKKIAKKKPLNKTINKFDYISNLVRDTAVYTPEISMQEGIATNEPTQIFVLDETTGELKHDNDLSKKKLTSEETSHPIFYNPNRLNDLCIISINTLLRISAHCSRSDNLHVQVLQKTLKKDSQNIPFRVTSNNHLPQILQPNTANNVPASTSKVIITSNQKVDLKYLPNYIKNKKKVTVAGATVVSNALEMKVVPGKSKTLPSFKTKPENRKSQHVNTNTHIEKRNIPIATTFKDKAQSNKTAIKKKKTKKVIESSSGDDCDDQFSVAETDTSDYDTFESYIDEVLNEVDQDEKENLEPKIPFGISDIDYFQSEITNLKQDDWIIAKFSTKKSVKHYVGQILRMKNSIPTVKFLRKVKNTKGNKLIFTYPNVEDVGEITHADDVILVLPQPTISRRGQVMFDADLGNFNLQ